MADPRPDLTVAGAVLCGGASRRMGTDKSLLPVDGVPMALRVATAMADAGCRPVVAVGGDRAALESLGLIVVDDEFPGEGPLGGVLTALDHAAGAAVVVIACDLPHVPVSVVQALVTALSPAVDAAVAVSPDRQPVCAAWAPGAAGPLRSMFLNGERRLLTALRALRVAEVPVLSQDLVNLNAPGDMPQ